MNPILTTLEVCVEDIIQIVGVSTSLTLSKIKDEDTQADLRMAEVDESCITQLIIPQLIINQSLKLEAASSTSASGMGGTSRQGDTASRMEASSMHSMQGDEDTDAPMEIDQ